MAYAAHVMRSVVVDFVRQARAQRRGGDRRQVALNTNVADSLESSESEILRLDETPRTLQRDLEKVRLLLIDSGG